MSANGDVKIHSLENLSLQTGYNENGHGQVHLWLLIQEKARLIMCQVLRAWQDFYN